MYLNCDYYGGIGIDMPAGGDGSQLITQFTFGYNNRSCSSLLHSKTVSEQQI
jgi:hypothetical protein